MHTRSTTGSRRPRSCSRNFLRIKAWLTIRLERKIPQYLAVLAMGGLPARDINVTASAWRQRSVGHPFGTRMIDASARWRGIETSTY